MRYCFVTTAQGPHLNALQFNAAWARSRQLQSSLWRWVSALECRQCSSLQSPGSPTATCARRITRSESRLVLIHMQASSEVRGLISSCQWSITRPPWRTSARSDAQGQHISSRAEQVESTLPASQSGCCSIGAPSERPHVGPSLGPSAAAEGIPACDAGSGPQAGGIQGRLARDAEITQHGLCRCREKDAREGPLTRR